MKQIFDIKKIEGKTIAKSEIVLGWLQVVFTDETFVMFSAGYNADYQKTNVFLMTVQAKPFFELPNNLSKSGFGSGEPVKIEELGAIRSFIRENFTFSPKINTKVGSYSLKHFVESRIGDYVANGDFVAAMILEGFKFEQDGKNAFLI
jgi:hypothetical protein